MQQSAAVRSLKQAVRVIKQMEHQSPEWMPDLHELGRKALRRVLHQHMQRQVRHYLVESARQGVADRRNGSYSRHLLTALGDLELCVPRTRRFSALGVVQAYARRERHVDRLILACFLLGLSTRKVGEALMTTLGERVSPATVSEVAKLLDREVAAFQRRPLTGPYRLLVFDGVVLSRRTGPEPCAARSWWRWGSAPTATRRSSTSCSPRPRASPLGSSSSPSSSAADSPPKGSS